MKAPASISAEHPGAAISPDKIKVESPIEVHPLPNPDRLAKDLREACAELDLAKRAPALRMLRTREQEKSLLVATDLSGPLDGIGRPEGPRFSDRYAQLLQPASASLDALERFERATRDGKQLVITAAAEFQRLDVALRATTDADAEIVGATHVENLLYLRDRLAAARVEHMTLVGALADAIHFTRGFEAKAERAREVAIEVYFEQLEAAKAAGRVADRRRVEARHAGLLEAAALPREFLARWTQRTGQPMRMPEFDPTQ